MAVYKIFNICIILFVIQNCYGKAIDTTSSSLETSEDKTNPSPKQKLLLYTLDNLLIFGKKFADKSLEISREILKDESLKDHTEPEILEFKQNLTNFVENYDTNAKIDSENWNAVTDFANVLQYLLDLPKDKEQTTESKFILDILEKYNFEQLRDENMNNLEKFVEDFKKNFDASKNDLEKPILVWYENFGNLSGFSERLSEIDELFKLLVE